MRQAHTVEQVRAAEAALMARLPEGALMMRAAHGLAQAVADWLGSTYGRRVLLLVGSGDNGGDALHAGALLARRGAGVEAWLLSDQVHAGGLAALRAAGGQVVPAGVQTGPRWGTRWGARPEVVVDGIVGIGGRPGLRPAAQEALARVEGVPVVAVDVPSGVDVDTGEAPQPHVRATFTVTFGTHKAAHLVDPAARAAGTVHLVDLGLDLPAPGVESLQAADVSRLLPRPSDDAHKYTRGVVGVRAGSATYPGAGLLSVAGAACGLAGMVRYVGDAAVADRVRQAHPEVVGAGRVQAWVVGSGTGDDAAATLAEALADAREHRLPVLVDADALHHLTGPLDVPAVLTPHAGELAAMLDEDRAEIEARPLHFAREAARRYGCVVLLKGRHTLVSTPDGRTRATTTGTPWLATAGAGDVLGGVIGALLAAGLDPFDAASVGSWLHGAAATLVSRGGPLVAGQVGGAVADVVRALPAP
ncbi:Bifunctional NAD(P)H-hydrate repair enzyme Nnr [Nocardioides dokdonensis FR1436]|uniref:Bifunctional NAD(P)H-hydrate repair enzyme n=1 Tax=Nocardioides dokdonensis FR1436 TaxID=1300347 RepID=A0A1A9GJ90_9ACTN|nr:bifunctional ADP-dependent NAD(P)H-hydrate dehydratase/NAD(P)H-hydrate epimerase [Nocardioides dokdonensis]ANH38397.1 Bifunctional NAD(P)H-hydrate repair enzyme Nnr [Nocardioides dokdonensis FR1436]